MTAAGNISFVVLIVSARMLQSCSGQTADLKCSLLPCRMEPPATLTTETDPSLRKPRSASSTPAAVQRNLAEPGGVPGPRSHPDRSGDIVKASGSIGAGAQGLDGRQ
jgi:hypothetical protein